MARWLKNLLAGAGSILELSPPETRPRFDLSKLPKTAAEAFRRDAEKIGGDFSRVVSRDGWQENADGRRAGSRGVGRNASRDSEDDKRR